MSVYWTCLLPLAGLCVLGAARSVDTSGGNEFRSDYTFSQEANGWLKLHSVPLDWHSARVQCYHEGVSLEQLYIQWHEGHPDNIEGQEQCLTYFVQFDTVTVIDDSCKKRLPYICYRPASIPARVTECGTVDEGYEMEPQTGHCYKFHAHAMLWTVAARVCQAEGGYLAVIDSQPEADRLADLFAAKTPVYSANSGFASVGLRMWGDKSWWTIHGKRLEDSGYSRWHKDEPNNHGGGEQCGSIFIKNGQLNDIPCDLPFAFICEKSPDSLLSHSGDVF